MEISYEGCFVESGSKGSSLQGRGPNINDLPWEVLQEIFCLVDGKSLLLCKRVCKRWREHIRDLEKKKNFWYDNCQKEIPPWIQFDLLDHVFPSHWKDQTKVNWEEIYKCWSIWNSQFKPPVTISKRFSGLQGISSVKVSGDWLLVSTCQSRGSLKATRLTCDAELIDLYVGGGAILDFELVVSDKQMYSNVRPSSLLNEIFDSLEHNEIWLELRDCYIQLGRTYCITSDKIQQRLSHSYGYEARLIRKQLESAIVFKKICSKIDGPELLELQLSSPYSHIADFWINSVSLVDHKLNKKVMIDAMTVNRKTQQALFSSNLSFRAENEMYDLYVWHASLFVIYTSKRKIVIHYKGEEKAQVTPINKGRVSSILFYANHFFFRNR